MTFIHEDFLLHTKTARRLYHEFAEPQPIIDYHNHLPPADIAVNRSFENLHAIWLAGDHYKWRAMRAAGVPERLCTGDAPPRDKFLAWAKIVPQTLRNPLYHWTHLELKRAFGIDALLSEVTAEAIWDEANAKLQTPELSTHGILNRFDVAALCTTDDPADSLDNHRQIARSNLKTRVYPAFRPDKAMQVDNPPAWNAWLDKLAAASYIEISTLDTLLQALDIRHTAFHDLGCRLSDHGLTRCYAEFPTQADASRTFDQARVGIPAPPEAHDKFAAYLMLHFGRLDSQRGWTQQLHLGPLRNVNTRAYRASGPDTGFDSMGDSSDVGALGKYLDTLDQENALPKTIVYNVNPTQNYAFATMLGNFQDGVTPGKMQFGSAWWFMDTREGIELQLNTLSNCGLLSRFVGMLTDSRSLLSFPRHEYFRRVLCNLLGADVERGELPDSDDLLGPLIKNICIDNARGYLALPGVPAL